jgi:hypothetical protein
MSTNSQSFTKIEHQLIHHYREHLNLADSQAAVRTVFSRTVLELLLAVFADKVPMKVEDITFSPGTMSGFALGDNLLRDPIFQDIWSSSDLPHIVARFAENAEHRFKYLQAHHEKTGGNIGRH